MVSSVTDTTCEFGLARSSRGCVTTLAALCGDAYATVQIVYCVAGFVALTASAYKLACAVRFHGATLQKQIFALCMYAALTIMLRGVDPGSYAHYIPRPLTIFLIDSCTATLHTILIKTLGFYIAITQHGARNKRQSLIVCERLAIALVWAFFLTCDALALPLDTKGFGGVRVSVVLYVSAAYLLVLSTSFVVYGAQVIKRLDAIERMHTQQLAFDSLAVTSRSVDFSSSRTSAGAVLEEVPRAPRKPAARIRKVLVVTETVSLLCIGAQVYFAVRRGRAPVLELECANGFGCDRIRVRVSPMHVFQYVWIWIALWSYWRTQQRETAMTAAVAPKTRTRCKAPFGSDHV